MSPAAMRRRCTDAQGVGPAVLEGYTFFVGREGWGSVRPRRGGTVHGVLWRVSLRDLAVLHAFELLHKGLYDLRRLSVSREGQRMPALIYVLRKSTLGRPRAGYIGEIAAAARDWRLPERYIRDVERWSPSRFADARGRDVGETAKEWTREFT